MKVKSLICGVEDTEWPLTTSVLAPSLTRPSATGSLLHRHTLQKQKTMSLSSNLRRLQPTTLSKHSSISIFPSHTPRIPSHQFSISPRQFQEKKQQEAPRTHLPPADHKPYNPPVTTSPRRPKSPLKVWPFVAIFATGTFLFYRIVEQRKGTYQSQGSSGHSPSRP
jgi:hypothetical protein